MRFLDDVRPCAGCGGHRGPLCPACRAVFRRPALQVRRDGLALPVTAAAVYDGPVREALVAFKDHGRWSLRGPLGSALHLAVIRLLQVRLEELVAALEAVGGSAALPPVPDPAFPAAGRAGGRLLLVPVPSSPRSVRERDGDHVAELAGRAEELSADELPCEVLGGLVVVRRRRDQVGLGREARAANLHGSMRATDVLVRRAARPGTAVVLVDDIVTTGASLAEAHRAMQAAGVRPLGAAVVAATPDLPRGRQAGSRLAVR